MSEPIQHTVPGASPASRAGRADAGLETGRAFRTATVAAYWSVTAALTAGAVAMLLLYTPAEKTMGPIQMLFYLHLPAAINTFLACTVVLVGSIGFLLQRRMAWDHLASAAARVAVVLGFVVLATGMIWARSAWGTWWTWSPRLTFTLVLWLLYVVYVVMRPAVESPERRAVVSAVYGIVAFLDVPLVYLTARLLPDVHPASIEMGGRMQLTLAVWFVPITLLAAGLIVARYRLARRRHAPRPIPPEPPLTPPPDPTKRNTP
ncbi:MAG: cytochrome c biogenesis protein CcsA [Phycisphaerae bacterium]